MSRDLTNNNWIYTSFSMISKPILPVSSKLDIENFYGIARFDLSTSNGSDLHLEFFNYCIDNDIKIGKVLEINWEDLSRWDISGCQFQNNYRNWAITNYLTFETFKASVEKAMEDVGKVEFYL